MKSRSVTAVSMKAFEPRHHATQRGSNSLTASGARRLRALPVLPFAVAALALLATPVGAAGWPFSEGDLIEFSGTVTDGRGQGVPNVRIALEASRKKWDLRSFNRRDRGRTLADTTRREALSDAAGNYTLQWKWYDYYNHFEMVSQAATSDQEYQRLEVTDRVRQGSPIVANFVVRSASTSPTASPSEDTSGLSSDQQKVFDELGRPEETRSFHHDGRSEVSWWYFGVGKAYRFVDGRLAQVVPFDPIAPF